MKWVEVVRPCGRALTASFTRNIQKQRKATHSCQIRVGQQDQQETLKLS